MCHHLVIYSAPKVWDQDSIIKKRIYYLCKKGRATFLGTVPLNKEDRNSSIVGCSLVRMSWLSSSSLVMRMGTLIGWISEACSLEWGYWLAGYKKWEDATYWLACSLRWTIIDWANKFNPVLFVALYHDHKTISLFLGMRKQWLANSQCQWIFAEVIEKWKISNRPLNTEVWISGTESKLLGFSAI